MTEQIRGHIETKQHGPDDYETAVRWTLPTSEDAESFIGVLTKRFEKELRDTIASNSE